MVVPHPDDETLTGLLPLRLRLEAGWRASVLPATLGSDPARRAARKAELRAACRVLGFSPLFLPDPGPDAVAAVLRRLRPSLVLFPHAADAHPRHRATHRLALRALDLAGLPCPAAETEYWHPDLRANLLAAAAPRHRALLLRALRCHAGELARTDYDRRLVPWMIDNVRRAAERLGGPGAPMPPRLWAGVLYRLRLRASGAWRPPPPPAPFLRTPADLLSLSAAILAAVPPAPGT